MLYFCVYFFNILLYLLYWYGCSVGEDISDHSAFHSDIIITILHVELDVGCSCSLPPLYQTHDIDYNLHLINLVIDSFMKSGHSKEFDSSFILILIVISDRWKRDRSDGYSANSFPCQIVLKRIHIETFKLVIIVCFNK